MKNEIVKVNDVQIECPFYEDQHFVAVKPICQVLGIDHSSQIRDLKKNGILGSVVVNYMTTTGSDGKSYEMVCIPLKFVFGWLFTIDAEKVKPSAREALSRYKMECYNALYEHFMKPQSNRGKVLNEKARLQREYTDLEEKLSESNDDFKRLMDIKAAIMRTGKELKEIDTQYITGQLELFD